MKKEELAKQNDDLNQLVAKRDAQIVNLATDLKNHKEAIEQLRRLNALATADVNLFKQVMGKLSQ